MSSNQVTNACVRCGKPITVYKSKAKRGVGKHCSLACRYPQTDSERFASKVATLGPVIRPELGHCHTYNGQIDHLGYGRFFINGRKEKAHRVAWLLHYGRWPEPCALHRCDNPSCVRVGHLFEGTKKHNTRDMVSKGRGRYVSHHGERHGRAKLSNADVVAIRAQACVETQASLARRYGVSATQVCAIVNGKARKTA